MPNLNLQLQLTHIDLSENDLNALTQDLNQTINRETNITAQLLTAARQTNTKGEPVTLGVLLLTFLSGGSALALIDVLKAYLSRDAAIEFELKSGLDHIKINAKNIHTQQVEQVLAQIQSTLTPPR